MPEAKQEIARCPRCGTGPLHWPDAKHFVCSACTFTLYLNPAAAVAVIVEHRGMLLLGVRKSDPGRGMLDLPGGFVDPGETAEEALLREVREETGLELSRLRYLFSLPNIYHYRGMVYRTVDMIFHGECHDATPATPGDDLAQLLWVPRDEIDLQAIAFTSLREAVRRYCAGDRPAERIVPTADVTGLVAEIPPGHRHLRTTLTLADGSTITLQEATVAAIVRSYTRIKTDPARTGITLRGKVVKERKQGFAEWQLVEDD